MTVWFVPLNDLVDKYGSNLPKNLMITIDDNIMAVAFMAAQHLFSRTDILKQAGVDSVPATYSEMISLQKLYVTQASWNILSL